MEKCHSNSFLKSRCGPLYKKVIISRKCPLILAALIPSLFLFELLIVLPGLFGDVSWNANVITGVFFTSNIVGNFYYVLKTDTTITAKWLILNKVETDWTICHFCGCMRPPFCRHCRICNICILCRDHHCFFFARCIGYFNFRYYFMFMFYAWLGMLQSLYLNIQMIFKIVSWSNGFVLLKFLAPLPVMLLDFNWIENLYVIVTLTNIILAVLTGYLLFGHTKTCVPNIKSFYNAIEFSKFKLVLSEAFGIRWYLVWISPLIKSPLLGDGTKKHALINGWNKCVM